MSPGERERLRVLLTKGTPLPWYCDDEGCIYSDGECGNVPVLEPHEGSTTTLGENNAALLSAAVNALPSLLDCADQVDALKASLSVRIDGTHRRRLQRMTSLVLAMEDYMGRAAHRRDDVNFELAWLETARAALSEAKP